MARGSYTKLRTKHTAQTLIEEAKTMKQRGKFNKHHGQSMLFLAGDHGIPRGAASAGG